MKWFIPLLFFVLAFQARGALTVTDRGSATGSVSNTSIAFSPTSTIVSGTLGVYLISCKNTGLNGSTKIFPSSFNDSVSNTWTLQIDTIFDPGAAGAGIEIAIYTAPILTQVTSSNNLTLTVSTAATGRTMSCYEVSGLGGAPTYVASGSPSDLATTGQISTAPTSGTTASLNSGDVVICVAGQSSNNPWSSGATDTTNGTWSSLLELGQSSSTHRQGRQYKIVTGAGTQTWNTTLASSATWHAAWLQAKEAASANTTNGFF